MKFIDNDRADIPKIGGYCPLLQEDLKGLRRDHQEMRGLAFLPRTVPFRNIPMPLRHREGCGGAERSKPLLLVVDQRLEWREVEAGDPAPAVFENVIHHRYKSGFRLPAGSGRDHQHIIAGRDRGIGPLLHFPEIGPREPLGDHALERFVQGGKDGRHGTQGLCPGRYGLCRPLPG